MVLDLGRGNSLAISHGGFLFVWLGRRFGALWQVPAIERGLGLSGVFGKYVEEEPLGFLALAAGGFKQAAQDAVIFQSFVGAGAVDDFAHDDHRPETGLAFCSWRG